MAETGNIESNNFLKNLQQSLVKGEKDEGVVEHLSEIHKKADALLDSAYTKMDERLEQSGTKQELNPEEREKAQEKYIKIVNEQKENDEKLQQLTIIEQQNARIRNLNDEFNEVKAKFAKKVEDINEYKIKLMAEFERKYGTKAEEEFDFGDQPKSELDKHDTDR